ncbi:hypothetical protein GCM10027447_24250 [Glycomyces halotolerans]
MAAAVRKPATGRVPAGRRLRRKIAAAAAGALAIGTAAIVVPGALAEEDLLGLEATVERLPVDRDLLGLIEVGEVVELTESLTGGRDDRVELSDPGAGYVKVHFERLELADGDFVTVSSPDGEESYRYDESAADRWATSITGDTAVIELHRAADGASEALGAIIDKAAFGFPEPVIDGIVDRKNDRARPTESICNVDDKRPSACYEASYPDVVDRTEPVARLLIDGTVLCTAFRVGEQNRLLTNNHCFARSWEARRTEVWFGYSCLECDRPEATTPVKVHGHRVLASSRDLDYTLFSVDDFEAVEPFGHLELATEAARRGTAIYIPQHPAGRPSEIAMDSSVDGGNCVVKDPSYNGYIAGSDIAYYCDTEFGSSGSPVLSRDSHEVIALHHFGGCPNSGVSAELIEREIRDLI